MVFIDGRSEIAFFDLETTAPSSQGQGFAILEFGSILVCPRKLIELESYSTLVCPSDLSHISTLTARSNGITRDGVLAAPTFAQIADRVYDILHGRIWAGHNIVRFDCVRIRDAFAQINRPPPVPKGTIDSLALLTQKFGRRAGDMKMASIATYFGLGKQTHRSLDDVRMNLEILKYCATVLFLESSLPDIFTMNSWVSPNATTRSRSNGVASLELTGLTSSPPSSSTLKIRNSRASSPPNLTIQESQTHPIFALVTRGTEGEEVPGQFGSDAFDLGPLQTAIKTDKTIEKEESDSSATAISSVSSNCLTEYLDPEQVSVSSITVAYVPFFRNIKRTKILYNDSPLQIRCNRLKVRFGVSSKYLDNAGRPRLSFVVDASPKLRDILEACDHLAKDLSVDSEWRPLVVRKPGPWNTPTIRLNIPFVSDGITARFVTEIYKNEEFATNRVMFKNHNAEELEELIDVGTCVDACILLDPYDYQQNAGIRLVARKLIIYSE